MVVKRTFTTTLEPVAAFGLSNEVLRPRGFELGKGTPPRSQTWVRGAQPGTKARSVFKVPQSIELEFDRNRINLTATAEVTGRKAVSAQRMLTGYAQSLELLLNSGATPAAAASSARRAERGIRAVAMRRMASVCVILLGVVGGGGYALTQMNRFPSPMKLINSVSGKQGASASGSATPSSKPTTEASSSKTKKAPVIVVRKAGAQTSAAPQQPDR